MLRLKCLRSEDHSGNRICFNSSLLSPYLKHANRRRVVTMPIPASHIPTGDFQKALGVLSVKSTCSM
ncbi:MAG: hypothetical protein ACTS73_09885 [Arsenophonus sp. NEOnobi-MAG3]